MHNNTHTHSAHSNPTLARTHMCIYIHGEKIINTWPSERASEKNTPRRFFALDAGAKSSDRTTDVNSCMCGLLFSYSLFRRASAERERENWPWSVSQHFYYRTLLIANTGDNTLEASA